MRNYTIRPNADPTQTEPRPKESGLKNYVLGTKKTIKTNETNNTKETIKFYIVVQKSENEKTSDINDGYYYFNGMCNCSIN